MSLLHAFPPALVNRKIDELFGVDIRSLALTRIVIALTVLADLCVRAESLTLYLGEHGVMPSELLYSLYPLPWSWSMHVWPGMPDTFLVVLFAVHAGIALCVLAGYRTRIATVALFICTVSLQHANPYVLQAGDTLQLSLIFINIFLPWGAAFSVDRARSGGTPMRTRILSGWSAALYCQMALMYLFTFLLKTGPEWTYSFTAVYYALSSGITQTWIGLQLLSYPSLLSVSTVAVMAAEAGAIIFLFFPFKTARVRMAAVCVLIGMHIVFMLCLRIGIFSWIAIAGLLAFVPTRVWEQFGRTAAEGHVSSVPKGLSVVSSAVGMLFIVYVATINVVYLNNPYTHAFVLRQRWQMYAPSPSYFNGWHAVPAQTESGREIDILRDGASYSKDAPARIADLYRTERDRKFMISIIRRNAPAPKSIVERYATVMCERWNATHDDRVTHLSVILMNRDTSLPGEAPMPPVEKVLADTDCAPSM